jgi:non-ribosomal peptide synthetase component F
MDCKFQGLGTLSPADQHLFNRFSRGTHIQPPFSLVHKAFEDFVDRHPESVAVEHDGHTLTYQQLDRAANILANTLIRDGLHPGEKVCLVVQRSVHMVVAILAVLKCGCQYVPLDGGVLPETLLSHIVTNTEAQFILCLQRHLSKVQTCPHGTTVVILDTPSNDIPPNGSNRPNVKVVPSDGAYVIFTSGIIYYWLPWESLIRLGTTGTPKGVDVSHRNVTNLLCLSPGSLGIKRGTIVPQLLSISFDMGN